MRTRDGIQPDVGGMQIRKRVVLALVLLAAASGQVPCPTGPLSEAQLTTLVKGKVAEVRVRQFITSCGLEFVADGAAVNRLKAAGATAAELEAVRTASALRVKADWALWETVEKRKSAAAYEEYLERFPRGMFAPAAREELEKLRAAERAASEEAERKRRAEAARLEAERKRPKLLAVNGVSMEFVTIPAGEFQMGSESGDRDERPAHQVRITKAFEMGNYEVTQAQWEAVMGNNPSHFKGADRPVDSVSWEDAQEFLSKLNARNDDYRYRLPTEAEWEFAARAGTTADNAGHLDSVAWYSSNSGGQTHSVGEKQANGWGLYDMLGNVGEWCQDWYDENYYRNSPAVDPRGPSSGSLRVLRGGSWNYVTRDVRVAYCGRNFPDLRLRLRLSVCPGSIIPLILFSFLLKGAQGAKPPGSDFLNDEPQLEPAGPTRGAQLAAGRLRALGG
jgi:formylglycine-generating enzyme required for sulfatase activity